MDSHCPQVVRGTGKTSPNLPKTTKNQFTEGLESYWKALGAIWKHLERSWSRLGEVLGASWVELGVSWIRFGAILAPSWVQLGANFGQLGSILGFPRPAKIGQNRPRPLFLDFSSQGCPPELPDPLRTSIFSSFGVIFKSFFYNFSKGSCITYALNF